MTKTFHSGGRIGDLIFQLWTMKALGGGILYISDYHHPDWDLKVAESLRSLLEEQEYVDAVLTVPYEHLHLHGPIDYDLQKAEDGPNGVTHIAERYARFFGLEFDGAPWLKVTPLKGISITAQIPMRRSIRARTDWISVLEGLELMHQMPILFGNEDIKGVEVSMLSVAQAIAGSKVFFGTVSCCNALAEGLGVKNLVEQASGCFNVKPYKSLNGLSTEEVIKEVLECLR